MPGVGSRESAPRPAATSAKQVERHEPTEKAEPRRMAAGGGGPSGGVLAGARTPERIVTRDRIGEMDLPTFIRRAP
jgi:hypothetical protein